MLWLQAWVLLLPVPVRAECTLVIGCQCPPRPPFPAAFYKSTARNLAWGAVVVAVEIP